MAKKTSTVPEVPDERTITTATAAQQLAIKDDLFRRRAKNMSLTPHVKQAMSKEGYRHEVHRWSPEQIAAVQRNLEQLPPKPRRTPDAVAVVKAAKLARKYGSPHLALQEAAEAMWNLNRYAKHGICSEANRREIYGLKNMLVEHLYREGYCVRAYRQISELAAKPCWDCAGGDEEVRYRHDGWDDWDDYEGPCRKCDGTGIYLPSKTLIFFVFSFVIGDHTYSWHQPDRFVNWPVEVHEGPETEWEPGETEKPLNISRAQLADAKALVKYAVS